MAPEILLCSKCASSRPSAQKKFSRSGISLKYMRKGGPQQKAFALVGTHAKAHFTHRHSCVVSTSVKIENPRAKSSFTLTTYLATRILTLILKMHHLATESLCIQYNNTGNMRSTAIHLEIPHPAPDIQVLPRSLKM